MAEAATTRFSSLSDFTYALTFLLSQNMETNKEENFTVSPVSVYLCLGLLNEGACGETKKEICKVLGVDDSTVDTEIEQVFRVLRNASDERSFTLKTSNGLFCNEGCKIEDQFIETLSSKYDAKVATVKFGTSQGEKIVNKWIEENTEGQIKEMLANTSRKTVVALVNAIYLKGTWVHKFDKLYTKRGKFTKMGGKTTDVSYMTREVEFFRYIDRYASEGFAAAFLPYESDVWQMGIILPKQGIHPSAFVTYLKQDNLENLYQSSSNTLLDVSIPKCILENQIDLIPLLKKLGVVCAFDERANLSKIGKNEDDTKLLVNRAVQKCFIDINEDGTKAAAVTCNWVIRELCDCIEPEPVPFHVHSPYLFFIFHSSTNIIAFSGIIANPNH